MQTPAEKQLVASLKVLRVMDWQELPKQERAQIARSDKKQRTVFKHQAKQRKQFERTDFASA